MTIPIRGGYTDRRRSSVFELVPETASTRRFENRVLRLLLARASHHLTRPQPSHPVREQLSVRRRTQSAGISQCSVKDRGEAREDSWQPLRTCPLKRRGAPALPIR